MSTPGALSTANYVFENLNTGSAHSDVFGFTNNKLCALLLVLPGSPCGYIVSHHAGWCWW
jgi:hypothetical protein